MKILILNNYYYPHMEGGAEFSVKILAEALVSHGCDVCVLSMDGEPGTDLIDYETLHGVKVYRSYSKSLYRRRILKIKSHLTDKLLNGINSIYNPKMNRDLKCVIDKVRPDVIHTQNMVSMSYWVWQYADKKNIPLIHTLRDYWLLDPTTNINQSPKALEIIFRHYHRKLSNKYVNMLTSPSDRTLEIFSQFGYFSNSSKKTVVNAIQFDSSLLSKCLVEKLGRKHEQIQFVFAGKVTESKGIKILINAFIESNVNAKLTICGSGDLDEWISSGKYPNVNQLGKLSQEKLFNEYKNADVLIVPSLWEEPFGRSVIEGAQYGLPTIGSNRGGIPEIIKKLKYGDVFDPEKKESLITLIKKYANRDYLNNLYLKGPQNLEMYSVEEQVKCFNEIYNAMLKNGDC